MEAEMPGFYPASNYLGGPIEESVPFSKAI
jgi:hypothetical protein